MEFKDILLELRTSKKLSQMALALETGLTQSQIARWELGKTEPTASALVVLSNFFGESVDYLLGLEK